MVDDEDDGWCMDEGVGEGVWWMRVVWMRVVWMRVVWMRPSPPHCNQSQFPQTLCENCSESFTREDLNEGFLHGSVASSVAAT